MFPEIPSIAASLWLGDGEGGIIGSGLAAAFSASHGVSALLLSLGPRGHSGCYLMVQTSTVCGHLSHQYWLL